MAEVLGPAGEERAGPECAAWLAGLVASGVPVALLLAALDEPLARPVLQLALALGGFAALALGLLAPSRPSARGAAAAAGGAAGILVGILLAQATPTVWPQSDVAWHGAKIALAAEGRWLEDPILRVRTIYPFLFSGLLGSVVALGFGVREVLWAVAPLSLAGGLFGFWRLARELGPPSGAAWAAIALPVVFYAPHLVYTPYLPSPFNLAQGALFLGLSLLVRGWREDRGRSVALGAFLLGLAGLCWYAHLAWIAALALVVLLARRQLVLPLVLGAFVPAAALLAHLALLARAGAGGEAGITGRHVAPVLGERLGGIARNLATLSGGEPLANAPAWIGPAILVVAVAAWARRPRPAAAGAWIVLAALPILGVVLVWAGLRLSFWEPFSWRYASLLYGLLLAWSAGARPWQARLLGGRELGPLLPLALVAISWVPARALVLVDGSRRFAREFETSCRPVADLVLRETAPDEPVLASTRTWELVLARGAPRPSLVDHYGGTYKYAPAAIAGPRWRLLQELEQGRELDSVILRLRELGFRLAVIGRKECEGSRGWRALAEGHASLFENEEYRVVDLARPGGAPWR